MLAICFGNRSYLRYAYSIQQCSVCRTTDFKLFNQCHYWFETVKSVDVCRLHQVQMAQEPCQSLCPMCHWELSYWPSKPQCLLHHHTQSHQLQTLSSTFASRQVSLSRLLSNEKCLGYKWYPVLVTPRQGNDVKKSECLLVIVLVARSLIFGLCPFFTNYMSIAKSLVVLRWWGNPPIV